MVELARPATDHAASAFLSSCHCSLRVSGCVKYTLPPTGWEFKQGVDSYGNDIGNSGVSADWTKLIAACDTAAAAGCVAVTTGGWIKTKVGSLVKTNDDSPCSGLLVRTGEKGGPIGIVCKQ